MPNHMVNAVFKGVDVRYTIPGALLLSAISHDCVGNVRCRNKIVLTVRSSRKLHGINNGN